MECFFWIGILRPASVIRNLEFVVQSLSCETNLSPIFHFFLNSPQISFSSELVRTHPFKLSEDPEDKPLIPYTPD